MSDGPYRQASEREPDEPPTDESRPWALQTWTSKRTCPVCDVPLFAARRERFRIDACGRCGGAWAPAADTQRMLDERSVVIVELGRLASEKAEARTQLAPGHACLDCDEVLARHTIAGRVVVDVCKMHGTWFDAGELEVLRVVLERLGPLPVPGLDEDIRAIGNAAELRDGVVGALTVLFGAMIRSD